MEIVTGATGAVHVTPIDDAVRNSNMGYANDKVVFTYYRNLEAQAITANEVRVFAGYGMNQGRLFKIPKNTYDSVTIENGSVGYKRADLIVARYTMDSQTGFENISLAVIRGQSGDSYVDPSYTEGDINNGDDLDDFPLYRVKINGMQIDGQPERLFTLLPDGGRVGLYEEQIEALQEDIQSLNNSKAPNNHASSETTYGKGDGTNYGHVKLSDSYNSTSSNTDGIAATPKAVKDAKEYVLQQMGQAGYGDMMSEVYTGSNGAIIQEKGGTGSTDGSINGVKLAKNGNQYGYMDGNTFKSFRQPTGNAGAGDVLSGKTFANASSDALTGTMNNYSNNKQTVTPSGGTGNETLALPAGYHNGVIVNRTNVYNKGKADAEAVTWVETVRHSSIVIGTSGKDVGGTAYAEIDLTNATSIKCSGISTTGSGYGIYKYEFLNSAKNYISGGTFSNGTTFSIPSGAKYFKTSVDVEISNLSAAISATVTFTIGRQAKKLR